MVSRVMVLFEAEAGSFGDTMMAHKGSPATRSQNISANTRNRST